PNPTSTGEYPCRPRLAVIGPPARDGGIAVGGKRDRHALAGLSHSTAADELLALLRPGTAAAREHPRPLGLPATHAGGIAVGGRRAAHSLPRRQWRFPRSAAAQLFALLRPNTAAGGEDPRRPSCSIVAGPANDGGVAVGGEGDGCTLGPQSPSVFAGGANELAAFLRPGTAAACEHPRCPSWADDGRPIAISVVRARPAHDCGIAVRGQRDGHALVGASHCAGAN